MDEQKWAADTAMHHYEAEELTEAEKWRRKWLRQIKKGEELKHEQSNLNKQKEDKINEEAEYRARQEAEAKKAYEQKNQNQGPKEWDNAIKTCREFHQKNGFPLNNFNGDGFDFSNCNMNTMEQEVFKLKHDSANGYFIWCTLCKSKLLGKTTFDNHYSGKCHTSKFSWHQQDMMMNGWSRTQTEYKSTTTTCWGAGPVPTPAPAPPTPAPAPEQYGWGTPKLVVDAIRDLDFLAKEVEKIKKFQSNVTKSQVNDKFKEFRRKYHPDKHPLGSQDSIDAGEASKMLNNAALFEYIREFLSQ